MDWRLMRWDCLAVREHAINRRLIKLVTIVFGNSDRDHQTDRTREPERFSDISVKRVLLHSIAFFSLLYSQLQKNDLFTLNILFE